MASHWERITQGQCNLALTETPSKPKTAREVKDAQRGRDAKLHVREARIAALRAEDTPEARKALRQMPDSWVKRVSKNPGKLYDRKAAREAKRSGCTIL